MTTFIAKYAERYLEPFELHDCDLVIDGDSLACNLYKDASGCNSAFGGDYDRFYRTVVEFFQLLRDCNVRPLVLLDGGYEYKKMRTVAQRLRNKISVIKHINPMNSKPIFPLMLKEVFVDAAKDCGVQIMRCLFEADNELASLARKLNCPVLSYDSDFYIFNVKYIPFITLTLKVHSRKEGAVKETRKLRKCEAKNLLKKTKAEKSCGKIEVSTPSKGKTSKKTIKYLDCCLYRIENLAGRTLDPEMLPLFAALLGNDYIDYKAFDGFFSTIGMKGINKKIPRQQKRVQGILNWLKQEKKETALEKVLTRMKKRQRGYLLEQMENATEGYRNEKSEAFDYFGLELREEEELSECASEEEDEISDDEEVSDEEGSEEQALSEEQEVSEEEQENIEENDVNSLEEEEVEQEEIQEEDNHKTSPFPPWFVEKYKTASFPRFFVDLLHLKMYINNPLIEHYPYVDCNNLALPIFHHIYALLYHPEEIPEVKYITRCIKVTNIQYVRMTPEVLPPKPLNTELENDMDLLKPVFERLRGLDSEALFTELENIPSDIQLYLLALVYTIHKSHHFDMHHIESLLACLVVLRTIDSKIEPIREPKEFRKKFGKTIQKEKQTRSKEDYPEKLTKVFELQKELDPLEKINFVSKAECMLVQEQILKFFHLKDIFKKKYDEFSTVILHGFSEFQSALYNLYSLNVLLGFPLEQTKMGSFYCGMFLYNMYTSLKGRDDVGYYLENHIFHNSKNMYEFYEYLLQWIKKFTPIRIGETVKVKKGKKKVDDVGGLIDMLSEEDLSCQFFKLNVGN